MYDKRVVIPGALKNRILKVFNTGHKKLYFWPNMKKGIEENFKSYRGCLIAAKEPQVKFIPLPKDDRPQSRHHKDFAGPMKGQYYLIVFENFSKWLDVMKRKILTCRGTI